MKQSRDKLAGRWKSLPADRERDPSRWRESFSRCFSRDCIVRGCKGGFRRGCMAAGGSTVAGEAHFVGEQRWCGLFVSFSLSVSSFSVSRSPFHPQPPLYFSSVHIFTCLSAPPLSPRATVCFPLRPSFLGFICRSSSFANLLPPLNLTPAPPRVVRVPEEEKRRRVVETGLERGTPGWRHY